MTDCNVLALSQVSTQLYVHAAGNLLLNYLKGLEADAVKSLTIVSEDGTEAMNTFIHRLLGKHLLAANMPSICVTVTYIQSGPCKPKQTRAVMSSAKPFEHS